MKIAIIIVSVLVVSFVIMSIFKMRSRTPKPYVENFACKNIDSKTKWEKFRTVCPNTDGKHSVWANIGMFGGIKGLQCCDQPTDKVRGWVKQAY